MAYPLHPGKNNSKKISELKPRDIITYHQSYSWIPVAQYDHRIDSYTNLAINISSITDYSTSYASAYMVDVIDEQKEQLNLSEWEALLNVGYTTNLGYITNDLNEAVSYSIIAKNIATYTFSYTDSLHGWQYLFGFYKKPDPVYEEYLYSELEDYILTPSGDKIIIDNGD